MPDLSFRDRSMILLLSFDMKSIDKKVLPRNTRTLVPTTDNQVQERSRTVWKEIRDRTLEAARTLKSHDGAGVYTIA